ncbi:hypothetical protein CHCC20335_0823 [Bacillus paralicheniformis]|nr:hypothetical protein CHCC20335_0823 [Bacillus paralicheniformis]
MFCPVTDPKPSSISSPFVWHVQSYFERNDGGAVSFSLFFLPVHLL